MYSCFLNYLGKKVTWVNYWKSNECTLIRKLKIEKIIRTSIIICYRKKGGGIIREKNFDNKTLPHLKCNILYLS